MILNKLFDKVHKVLKYLIRFLRSLRSSAVRVGYCTFIRLMKFKRKYFLREYSQTKSFEAEYKLQVTDRWRKLRCE